jgi:hypothetical protein
MTSPFTRLNIRTMRRDTVRAIYRALVGLITIATVAMIAAIIWNVWSLT